MTTQKKESGLKAAVARKLQPRQGFITTLAERNYYGVYFTGQNIFYFFVTGYMTTYLMMQGVDLGRAASVMLLVKIWDAVNDTLFGIIFDKIKFKSGKKCTPWLKISTPFIALTTVALFWSPADMSGNAKLAWFAVAYFFWDTAYTLCDVPIFTMVTTMTDNLDERNNLYTRGRIFSGIGNGIVGGAVSILVSEKIGWSFSVIAIILSAVAFIVMCPAAYKCKERNYNVDDNDEENFSIGKMFRYLFKNKYLLLYYLGYLLSQGMATGAAMTLFVSYYMFGSAIFSLFLSVVQAVPSAVISVFTPAILRHIDKRKLYLISSVIIAVSSLAIYFAGYSNIAVFVVLTVIRSIPSGVTGMLGFMFTPDCAEYGRYRSGTDARGITFAIQTFTVKVASAVSSSLGLGVLSFFGWKAITASSFEEIERLGIVQSAAALDGLWIVYALVPAIGAVAALIPWFMYKLSDKDVQVMAKCNAGEISREEAEAQLSRKY